MDGSSKCRIGREAILLVAVAVALVLSVGRDASAAGEEEGADPQSALLPAAEDRVDPRTLGEIENRFERLESELRSLRAEHEAGRGNRANVAPWYMGVNAGWCSLGLAPLRREMEKRATDAKGAFQSAVDPFGSGEDVHVASRGSSGSFASEVEIGRVVVDQAGIGVRVGYASPGTIRARTAGRSAAGDSIDGVWKVDGFLFSVIGGIWAEFGALGKVRARGWCYGGQIIGNLRIQEDLDVVLTHAAGSRATTATLHYGGSAPCLEIGGTLDTSAGEGARVFFDAAYRYGVIGRMGLSEASVGSDGSVHREGESLVGAGGSPIRIDLSGVIFRVGIRIGFPEGG